MTLRGNGSGVHALLREPSDGAPVAEMLLGNEAIVRGALEAGVALACGYPGTPSSEITDSFARIAPEAGLVFEYSVNEKIALEMAFAASLAGARSLCAMKHLGLMVAGDPLSTIPYVGTVGGMVIVSPADPSCRTSPNEQDQRYLGPMMHIPVLEPSTPQEALRLARFAFELSEASQLPVLLRPTTRVCHSRALVAYGPRMAPRKGSFQRAPDRFVPIPVHARRMRLELPSRLERAGRAMGAESLFVRHGEGPRVVLAAGAASAVCLDVVEAYGMADALSVYALASLHPLPEQAIAQALAGAERVLVVEELSPFVEDALAGLRQRFGLDVEVLGKRTGHLPTPFEYSPEVVLAGLVKAFPELAREREQDAAPAPIPIDPSTVPPRPPSLCPGCGHRAAFLAARSAFPDEQLFFNDIGCYTLGFGPPMHTADAVLSMGSSFTMAAGVSRITGQRTVAFMGDSTFFHSGLPALVNAAKANDNVVAIVMDNQVTAMTGFQESVSDSLGDSVSIEAVARAVGVADVVTVDPYDLVGTITAFHHARDASGLSVVVVRRPCPIYEIRRKGRERQTTRYQVDAGLCRRCGRESDGMRCAVERTEGYQRHLARSHGQQTGAGCKTLATAPCSDACPLSLCVQGYLGHIAAGETAQARAHILARTPLPETVCRVCHRPCERSCVRAAIEEPVAINDLKRFALAGSPALEAPSREPEARHGLSVAVVGAGPAGLAAAFELALRGYGVKLFEARARAGGLLTWGIPAYRLPPEVVEHDVQRVLALGVELVCGVAMGRDLALDALLRTVDAVFLGLGAQRSVSLVLDGAVDGAVVDALSFLTTPATNGDWALRGHVAVIGGGNAAIDAARTARRRGAARVTLACLEAREDMPALPDEIVAAEREGVVLLTRVRPLRFDGGSLVLGPVDGAHGGQCALEAGLVISAIGQTPELGASLGAIGLSVEGSGCLVVDAETGQTSHERVFAGGDMVPGERSVTSAIAGGQRAAWGIDATLRGRAVADRWPPPKPPRPAAPWRGRIDVQTERAARHHPPELEVTFRTGSFDEVFGTFDAATARDEARRCLACGSCGNCSACIDVLGCPALTVEQGRVGIDQLLCNGCGLCVDICPNGAIQAVDVP